MTLTISLLKLKHRFVENKQFVIFSFLKYVEYSINAFLFFSIARHVSPGEYGSASSSFLLISYSGFVVLGVNQVLVKRYSINNENSERQNLLVYTLVYNTVFSGLLFLLVFLLFKKDHTLAIALICSSKLITEAVITIFRVTTKSLLINITYILQALLFLALYLSVVKSMDDFFEMWAVSAVFGMILAIGLFLLNRFIKGFDLKNFMIFWKAKNLTLLKEGILFTGISIIGVIYISLDRFFYINIYRFENTALGTVQLSDSISNVITLGISSFLFVLTPSILNKLSTYSIERKMEFIKLWYKRLLILLLVVVFLAIPLSSIVEYFYQDYRNLQYPLIMALIIKFLNLALFVPNMLYIVLNKEFSYVKIASIGVIFMFVIMMILKMLSVENTELFYIVPVILIIGISFVHILFLTFWKSVNF